VNDVGDNPDQLSILQHALNRTWDQWPQAGGHGPLTLSHYEAVGTMAHALSRHAEEAFEKLPEGRERVVASLLFKAITDTAADARGTRRPTRMDALGEITGATAAELTAVIDVFREPSRSFLMPPAGTPLTPDIPIDISHESLMRVWDRLRAWADEEALSAQIYRRLAETAELHRSGHAGLLRPPDLQFALNWRERQQPRRAWAERYRGGFDEALGFLQESERAFDEEARAEAARRHRQVRARRIKLFALPVLLFLAVVGAEMFYLYKQAAEEKRDAQIARENAVR
jgi:conflict system STAND superfamily ATPase